MMFIANTQRHSFVRKEASRLTLLGTLQLHNIFVNAFLFGQHTLLNITRIHINIEVANGEVAL